MPGPHGGGPPGHGHGHGHGRPDSPKGGNKGCCGWHYFLNFFNIICCKF